MGKIVINKSVESNYIIEAGLDAQDLYEAYVALTAYIATRINNKADITIMARQAAIDALEMLENAEKQGGTLTS